MDITQIATQLIQEKFGENANIDSIQETVASLFGGEGGKFDLGNIVQQMMSSGGLGDIVGSWLGEGENSAISLDQVTNILGEGKIADLASPLNIDPSTATEGLSEILPQLIDKSSSGGSLLEAAGGLGGLLGMAKKFF